MFLQNITLITSFLVCQFLLNSWILQNICLIWRSRLWIEPNQYYCQVQVLKMFRNFATFWKFKYQTIHDRYLEDLKFFYNFYEIIPGLRPPEFVCQPDGELLKQKTGGIYNRYLLHIISTAYLLHNIVDISGADLSKIGVYIAL